MHFGIQIDGRFVDLDERYGITVTLINPAYDQESVDRRYSYGAKMQNTPKTKAILAHADRLDVKGKASYECTFYLQGIPFDRGLIYLDVTTQDHINFHYASASIELINKMKEQKPIASRIVDDKTEGALDIIELPLIAPGKKRIRLISFLTGNFNIYINDKTYTFFTASTDDEINIMENLVNQINADYPGLATHSNDSSESYMDFESDLYDIDIRYDKDRGFYPEYTFDAAPINETFAEVSQNTVREFVTSLLENPDPRFSMPMIYAPAFYADKAIGFFRFLNYNIHEGMPENLHYISDDAEYAVIRNTIVPMLRVKYLLETAFDILGMKIKSGGVWDYDIMNRLLLFNTYSLDWLRTDQYRVDEAIAFENRKINGFRTTIDLNKNAPDDMSLADVYQGFLDYFNLYYRVEQNKIIIRRKIDQVYQRAINWTSKAEPEYENTRQFNLGAIYRMKEDSNDNIDNTKNLPDLPSFNFPGPTPNYESQLDPVKLLDGKKEINLPARTLVNVPTARVDSFNNPGAEIWFLDFSIRTCRSFHTGTSPDLVLTGKSSLTFIFENGLRPDLTNEYLYLQSSNDDILLDDTEASDYSLQLGGDRGIVQKWHRDFPKDDEHNVISKKIRLSVQDLLQLRTWENPRRRIYHEKGEIDCLIKSVQIRITPVGMEPSIVELVKIN